MKSIFNQVVTKKVAAVFMATFLLIFTALTLSLPQKQNIAAAYPQDCDNNAIMYCGVDQGALRAKYNALDAVGKSAYSHAGINPADLDNVVQGQVTRDNRVVVNGQTVATNVFTYGRQNMPGSTQIPGGAYMRHPSVSFASDSLLAYVHMDGREFKWAVIASCGNPVQGPPTFRNNPKVSIVKKANKTVVAPGETFNYTITVKNIGNVALHNVVVADVLPTGLEPVGLNPGVTYNPNTRKITWPTVALLPVGQSFDRTFKVKVAANASGSKKNIACVITNANPTLPICDDVTVRIKKPPTPPTPPTTPPTTPPQQPPAPQQPVPTTELPDTGPGAALFGVFTATSGVASAVHFAIKRKLFL